MRRSKYLLLALLVSCLCGCGADAALPVRHSVALIVKSTDSEFFLSVFAGARAAATEYNLDLTISGPETEEDYETQNWMIDRAVEDGAERRRHRRGRRERCAHRVHRQRRGLRPCEHLYRNRQLRRR